MKNTKIIKYLSFVLLACVIAIFGCGEDSSTDIVSPPGSSGNTGQGGSLARFTIMGDTLYAARHASQSTINTYDISSSTTIREIGSHPQSAQLETLFPLPSRNLLLSGTRSGMYIFKPTSSGLERLDFYEHVVSCDPVVANDNYAFVTLREGTGCFRGQNQLDVLDIRDPYDIKQINTELLDRPKGLSLDGNLLFVCEATKIKVFNVTDPLNLRTVQTIDLTADDVIARNGILMIMNKLGIRQYTYNSTGQQVNVLSAINYTP